MKAAWVALYNTDKPNRAGRATRATDTSPRSAWIGAASYNRGVIMKIRKPAIAIAAVLALLLGLLAGWWYRGTSDSSTDSVEFSNAHRQRRADARRKQQEERAAGLLPKLRSPDARERGEALASLVNPDGGGGYTPEAAIPDLMALLKSDMPNERAWAAGGLGHLEKPVATRAIEALLEALDDEDSHVRFRAAEALGRLGSEQAVPHLTMLTKDTDGAIRDAAAKALLKIGTVAACDAFAAYASDEVRNLLKLWKSPEVGVQMDAHIRLEAIIAGADATREDAFVPLLIAILNDPGPAKEHLDSDANPINVKLAAVRALQQFDSIEARTAVAAFATDHPTVAR